MKNMDKLDKIGMYFLFSFGAFAIIIVVATFVQLFINSL